MKLLSGRQNDLAVEDFRKWNLWLTGLFAVQALVILLLSTTKTFSITTSFLAVDSLQSTTVGSIVLAPASKHLFDLNMAYLLAIILLISGLTHALMMTLYQDRYEANLHAKRNPLRWTQYAIGCGLMCVAVAVLAGMYDFVSLLLVFGLVAASCLLFMVFESAGTPRGKTARIQWTGYWVAFAAGGLPWLAILVYLFATEVNGSGQAGYIYALTGSILVLCAAFAANLILYLKQYKRWKSYLFVERNFMILNLLISTALVWQIYFGILGA